MIATRQAARQQRSIPEPLADILPRLLDRIGLDPLKSDADDSHVEARAIARDDADTPRREERTCVVA
jgi:hypothetical protein